MVFAYGFGTSKKTMVYRYSSLLKFEVALEYEDFPVKISFIDVWDTIVE